MPMYVTSLRMHLLFQAVRRIEEEAEVVSIIFEKLGVKWHDRILEVFLVETLSFEILIDFFNTEEK